MKDLKKSLEKLAGDLSRAAEQVEKLAGELTPKPKAKPAKKTAAKKASKKPAQPTAVDTVYKAIARLKKGADMAAIKQKTGYDKKNPQPCLRTIITGQCKKPGQRDLCESMIP